jgi:putative acetyltransferase
MTVIKAADPREPAITKMIADLDAYQSMLYPPESNHLDPIEKLVSGEHYFIAVWENKKPLGIASFKRSSAHYVELKRLYVLPKNRGKGLARKLVAELERKARQEGYSEAKLETGVRQSEALALYEKLGYEKTEPFGAYKPDPHSIFMTKSLL